MQNIWIYALVVLAAFQAKRIGTFFNLCKMRLQEADWEPCSRSEMPEYLRQILGSAESALVDMGFGYMGARRKLPLVAGSTIAYTYADLYWNATQTSLAWVERADLQTGKVVAVQFQTLLDNGRGLLTCNRAQYLSLPYPPLVELADPYADTLAEQWACHQQRVQALAPSSKTVSEFSAATAAIATTGSTNQTRYWVQSGFAIQESEHLLRLSLGGAWRYMRQITSPPAAMQEAVRRTYTDPGKIDSKAIVLRDLEIITSNISLARTPLPFWFKLALFAATLMLGALSFSSAMEMSYLGTLMLTLLIHESGHWLAMRLMGYQNVSIFFLPFFGAATTGHKPAATPMQEVFVALAGPVCGLLIAGLLICLPPDTLPPAALGFTRQFVTISIALNLLNLLPFGILDGGKVIEYAVLGRFPYARVAFKMLGIVLGLGAAYAFENYMLLAFMVAIALGIPRNIKVAGLVRRILRKPREAAGQAFSTDQAIEILGSELADEKFHGKAKGSTILRMAIAREALGILQKPLPGLKTAIGGMGLLAGIWIVALAAWVLTLTLQLQPPLWASTQSEIREAKAHIDTVMQQTNRSPEAIAQSEKTKAFVAGYLAEAGLETRWKMLSAHEREIEDGEREENRFIETEHFEWVEAQKQILLTQLPYDHPGRVSARAYAAIETLAMLDGPPREQDWSALDASIEDLTQHGNLSPAHMDTDRLRVLADVLQMLIRKGGATQVGAQTGNIEALSDEYDKRQDVMYEERAEQTQALARTHVLLGNIDAADRAMHRYVADATERASRTEAPGDKEYRISAALIEYGWYLIDTGRADKAFDLARQKQPGNRQQARWLELGGWAAMSMNHPDVAAELFEHGLQARKAQAEAAWQGTWWQRWLRIAHEARENRATLFALDQYIALRKTDPAAAASLAGKVTNWGALRQAVRTVEFGYWGQKRAASYRSALVDMGQWDAPKQLAR
jgi:Zn-dependent protease